MVRGCVPRENDLGCADHDGRGAQSVRPAGGACRSGDHQTISDQAIEPLLTIDRDSHPGGVVASGTEESLVEGVRGAHTAALVDVFHRQEGLAVETVGPSKQTFLELFWRTTVEEISDGAGVQTDKRESQIHLLGDSIQHPAVATDYHYMIGLTGSVLVDALYHLDQIADSLISLRAWIRRVR